MWLREGAWASYQSKLTSGDFGPAKSPQSKGTQKMEPKPTEMKTWFRCVRTIVLPPNKRARLLWRQPSGEMPKKTSWKGALCCHRLSEQLKQARAAAATMEIYGAVTVNRRNASICFNVKLAFRVHCEGVGTEIRPYMENKLDQQSSIKLVYLIYFACAIWEFTTFSSTFEYDFDFNLFQSP